MNILDERLRGLYERLAGTGLPVFVGGSIAAMYYGEPRSTLDIDVVVRAGPNDLEKIEQAFPAKGFYRPPPEVIRAELELDRGGQFNVIDLASGLKADVYVAGSDPLITYGFQTATSRKIEGGTLNVASATYVVAVKLRFYTISKQDKHVRDIRNVLAVSPDAVDLEKVESWARQWGALDVWEQCLRHRGEE